MIGPSRIDELDDEFAAMFEEERTESVRHINEHRVSVSVPYPGSRKYRCFRCGMSRTGTVYDFKRLPCEPAENARGDGR